MRLEGKASRVRLRRCVRGRKYPEARKVLCSVHPASRHMGLVVTAQINKREFVARTVNEVVIHPAPISDPNIDNLALFYSLQMSMASVANVIRCKLPDAVQKCWVAFSEDQIQEGWNRLFQIQICFVEQVLAIIASTTVVVT